MTTTQTEPIVCQHGQHYHFGRGGSDPEHQQHQADISMLLDHHQMINRQIELLENGFSATTTTEHPELVEHLQRHVKDMKARFAKGRAIRSWDAVYALLFSYREEINIQYHWLDNGVSSLITTENPALVELLHAHAKAVSGFVAEGRKVSGESYPISEELYQLLNLNISHVKA